MKLLFLILIFGTVSSAIYVLLSPKITESYCRIKLTSSDPDSPELLPQLLRAFLPRKCVMTSISLPIPGKEGEEISYGTVAVTKAGIFLICRICGNGLVENRPGEETWRLMSKGSITEFPNPFKEQDAPRRLMAFYANAAGVKNVKVHTLIVYTDSGLRFSDPAGKGVIHVSSLYKRIKKLSSKGKLTVSNIRAIAGIIADANAGIADIPIA